MKLKRLVYRVQWRKATGRWTVSTGRFTLCRSSQKAFCVAWGRLVARRTWVKRRHPSQLVVYGKDGRVQYENTYGRDPRRFAG
jgi:hypothetical protein